MKMKGLFFGMLAFWSLVFVGCSDDVIETDNPNGQGEKVPAYLTVSFSTGGSSSRSTADDANNTGDSHNKTGEAGQEHSGHINAGTTAENVITQVLLVVKHTGEAEGFAKLYDAPTDGFPAVTGHIDNETCYQLTDSEIELSTSEYPYEVLVVANPYEDLYEQYENDLKDKNGVREKSKVDALYKAILTGQTPTVDKTTEYNPGGAWNNFATNIVQTETTEVTEGEIASTSLKCIMMANKEKCTALLKNSGDEVFADVVIERVASKITFRETNSNLYEVEVPDLTSVKIKQHSIDGKNYNVGTITTKGEDDEQVVTTYYVQLSNDGKVTKLYSGEAGKEIELTELAGYTKDSFNWVYEAGQYQTKTWKVKLEQYALVNLSKQVYNVRHTIAENSVAVPFGKLTGSNFLYTPNWETTFNGGINNVKFGEDGEFDEGFTTSPWFYNTLANVSVDSKDSENNIYFSNLGLSDVTGTDDNQDVTPDDTKHDSTAEEDAKTGYLLAYCLENTTDVENQTHGLSTGITFMGKIYEDDGKTPISTLYRYNGYLFESIDAIKTAWSIDENDTDWNNITDESGTEALAAVGVVKYDSNTCYYYTTEIKHFDNGKPLELGNMEFAIMRNNIYSLSVSGINIIGDPWVDPIPSTPDEVAKPKLEVHAEIMPWIVRYHDIEF